MEKFYSISNSIKYLKKSYINVVFSLQDTYAFFFSQKWQFIENMTSCYVSKAKFEYGTLPCSSMNSRFLTAEHTWFRTADADDRGTKVDPNPESTDASGSVVVVTGTRASELGETESEKALKRSISAGLAAGGAGGAAEGAQHN